MVNAILEQTKCFHCGGKGHKCVDCGDRARKKKRSKLIPKLHTEVMKSACEKSIRWRAERQSQRNKASREYHKRLVKVGIMQRFKPAGANQSTSQAQAQ